MKCHDKSRFIKEIKTILWVFVRAIEITSIIFVIMPLIGILYGNPFIGRVMTLKDVLGDEFSEAMLYNLGLILSLTVVLVFANAISERKSYKKLYQGIKDLAEGRYETRLTYSRFSSWEYREFIDQFNIMAQELASTESLQHNFMNDASHEFKTPIASIQGFAKVLRKKYILDEEGSEYLDIIIQESKRLTKLSDNVLLLCKLEEQVLVREQNKYQLADQITRSILLLQREWESKNIKITLCMDEVVIQGNEILLQQVWLNLIGNAIKFSAHSGEIAITLKVLDDKIKVSIKDYGPGIDEKYLEHIFKRFYRVATSLENQGNGIGLSIVKRVTELHKGEVQVESKVGEGTCFHVLLPK